MQNFLLDYDDVSLKGLYVMICSNLHEFIAFFSSHILAICDMTWKAKPSPSLSVAY